MVSSNEDEGSCLYVVELGSGQLHVASSLAERPDF